jgi:hypothetical protein
MGLIKMNTGQSGRAVLSDEQDWLRTMRSRLGEKPASKRKLRRRDAKLKRKEEGDGRQHP